MWPALIAGGAALAGTLLSNDETKNSAQAQERFQERMSSTAYQRGMEDMKAAGLNPMLAYSQGGASVPTGSMYQAQNPGVAFANAYAGATSAKAAEAQVEQQEPVAAATAKNLGTQSAVNVAQKAKIEAETRKAMSDADISFTTARHVLAVQSAAIAHMGGAVAADNMADEKLREYAKEFIVKPDVAAAVAKLEERSNQAELQKLLNMPAANAAMQLMQFILRASLAFRSK